MKFYLTLLLSCLVGANLLGQKIIEKNIDYNNQYITVDVKFASEIEVKTWDKSSVYFKADIKTKEGKFLEFYKLDVSENSGNIDISSDPQPVFDKFYDEWHKNNPRSKEHYYNCGKIYEFNYVLYVPKNARFELSSINGNLTSEVIEGTFTADLINGDIVIKKYSGELELSTINGEIDLKMTDTRLVAETIHGHIYADERLDFEHTDRHVGQKIVGQFDNASSKLRLNTINGNMFLRL